jgi:DNA (cytosine-5)-methyltransferase 1
LRQRRRIDAVTSMLVVEPLRWALALKPRWIALEQVPPVMPLWEVIAERLRAHGYSTWTGKLSAERYGVPQTRERAILLASLTGPVSEPPATHQRYIAPRRRDEPTLGLFDAPDQERIVLPEDRHLEPWVSMAAALGWDADDKVGFPRRIEPGDRPTADGYRERDFRLASQPALVLTEKARSTVRMRANGQPNDAAVRGADEPAPTITGGHDTGGRVWVVETGNFSSLGRDADGGRSKAGSVPYTRAINAPSPTVDGQISRWKVTEGAAARPHLSDDGWPEQRPATTVAGDPRVFPPGGHIANDGRDNSRMVGRPEGAVRVSLQEALVLQSFPPGYPVQGSRTKQFEQVGNAVPVLLARAVLAALLPDDAGGAA